MIAVADTSPLCYLILVGEVDMLPSLFERILLPAAVRGELLHEDAPEAVRKWALELPAWAQVHADPAASVGRLERLQSGERAAICLAKHVKADMVLLDEKAARRAASDLGLAVTGTLGILCASAARGLVQLAPAIDRLSRTNFRISPALLKAALDRMQNR